MSKAEILAELPNLKPEELAEVQAKLDQLTGDLWLDQGTLTEADKGELDHALDVYAKNPLDGDSWETAKARIQAKLDPGSI